MSGFTHEKVNSITVERYTPQWLFEAIPARDGSMMRYDLDPCHPVGGPLPWVPATAVYTREDDGLAQAWVGRVWLNPPYGEPEQPCKPNCKKQKCAKRGHCVDERQPGTEDWLAKMHEHRDGISLLFARTDTDWFHDYIAHADGTLLLNRRVNFVDAHGNPVVLENGKKGSPGSGSMLTAWGRECRWALIQAGLAGLGTFADLS